MISRNAERRAGLHHIVHQFEAVENARPSIDQVADENRGAPLRMRVDGAIHGRFGLLCRHAIVQFGQKLNQLVVAAVNVSHNVERTVQIGFVIPQGNPLNSGGINFLF